MYRAADDDWVEGNPEPIDMQATGYCFFRISSRLTEEDLQEWLSGFSGWEQKLDVQYERRMEREAVIWKDPEIDEIEDHEERMWAKIEKSLLAVYKFLEGIGMEKYYDCFISKGVISPQKLKYVNRVQMDKCMTEITDKEDAELLLDACAKSHQNEEYRFWEHRYGHIDKMMSECKKGLEWLQEKRGKLGWLQDEDLRDLLMAEIVERERYPVKMKWGIPQADFDLLNPDSDFACAVGTDGRIFLWPIDESPTPPCVRCRQFAEWWAITVLNFNREKMKAIVGGFDSKAYLYDVREDKILGEVRDKGVGQNFTSGSADVSVGKGIFGTNLGYSKLVDFEAEKIVLALPSHKANAVTQMHADWGSNQVASCGWDGVINIQDLRTCKSVKKIESNVGLCDTLAVDFERQLAVSSAFKDERLKIWDLGMGVMINEIATDSHMNCINVDWENMKAATGGDDGFVNILDLETGEMINSWYCDHVITMSMDVDWKKGRVLTGSWDAQIGLWDLHTGERLKHFVKNRRLVGQVNMTK